MALISKVLQAVLEVSLPILVSALAAWLVAKTKEIFVHLKNTNPELAYMLESISRCAVHAAEQLYKGQMRGKEKKEYAVKVVEAFLKSKNIDLDVEVIGAYIEAAVRDMNLYPPSNSAPEVAIPEEKPNGDVPTAVQE